MGFPGIAANCQLQALRGTGSALSMRTSTSRWIGIPVHNSSCLTSSQDTAEDAYQDRCRNDNPPLPAGNDVLFSITCPISGPWSEEYTTVWIFFWDILEAGICRYAKAVQNSSTLSFWEVAGKLVGVMVVHTSCCCCWERALYSIYFSSLSLVFRRSSLPDSVNTGDFLGVLKLVTT
jgi:hypothetical protein